MSLFLFRFWPVLLPLLVYWLWHLTHTHKARKKGDPLPRFRDGPWYWIIISSLLISMMCFLFAGLYHESNDGAYIPPHVRDGKIVPGHLEP